MWFKKCDHLWTKSVKKYKPVSEKTALEVSLIPPSAQHDMGYVYNFKTFQLLVNGYTKTILQCSRCRKTKYEIN